MVNNKVYIGQTNRPKHRWLQHKSSARRDGDALISRAIRKHKVENFEFEVIAMAKPEDINQAEMDIIAQYDATNKAVGYNVAIGGSNIEKTPEIRRLISKGLRKYYRTHNGPFLGREHTQESRDLMSKVSMGKPGTNTGKHFTKEHKRRISDANFGKQYKKNRRFSDEDELRICEMYKTGRSGHSIAKELKCAKTTIAGILERNNIQKHDYGRSFNMVPNKFSKEEELEITRMYNEDGVSLHYLVYKFDACIHTISRIIKRNIKDQNV